MLIKGARVFNNGRFINADIRVKDGKISEMITDAAKGKASDEDILDRSGYKIIPGLIDIHTHGRIGLDFTTASEDEIHRVLRDYLKAGVTGVLATVMTNDKSILLAAFERIGRMIREQRESAGAIAGGEGSGANNCEHPETAQEATILGINFEGVWLAPKKRGAHLEEYLELPTVERFDEYYRASDSNIRLATIAPELEGAVELISLKKDLVHFSLGHSEASYEEALKAAGAGADHATHLFNAMPALGHRLPGLAGAVLDKGLYTEIITDGYHVHPALIRMVFDINGDNTVLISDSIAPAGLENGVYTSGGQQVTAKDGKILTSDGTIAGSGISLFEGLKLCVTQFGIDEEKAVKAASYNAAASVGLAGAAGEIAVGRNADMIVIDEEYNIIDIFKNGIRL